MQQFRMWFVVPLFPHNLHLSEAPHFQRFRFAGVGSVSMGAGLELKHTGLPHQVHLLLGSQGQQVSNRASPGGCGHGATARLIAWGLLFGQTGGKQQFISRLIARLLDSYQMDIILLHAWSTILQGNNKFLWTSEISGIKKSILAFGVFLLPTKGN